jgi:hypothetical protein
LCDHTYLCVDRNTDIEMPPRKRTVATVPEDTTAQMDTNNESKHETHTDQQTPDHNDNHSTQHTQSDNTQQETHDTAIADTDQNEQQDTDTHNHSASHKHNDDDDDSEEESARKSDINFKRRPNTGTASPIHDSHTDNNDVQPRPRITINRQQANNNHAESTSNAQAGTGSTITFSERELQTLINNAVQEARKKDSIINNQDERKHIHTTSHKGHIISNKRFESDHTHSHSRHSSSRSKSADRPSIESSIVNGNPPSIKIRKTFDGTASRLSLPIREFVRHVDHIALSANWSDSVTFGQASSHLTGLAESWFSNQDDIEYSWKQLRSALLSKYDRDESPLMVKNILASVQQKHSESVMEYTDRYMANAERYALTQPELYFTCYVEGMIPQLRANVERMNARGFDDATNAALTEERSMYVLNNRSPTHNNTHNVRHTQHSMNNNQRHAYDKHKYNDMPYNRVNMNIGKERMDTSGQQRYDGTSSNRPVSNNSLRTVSDDWETNWMDTGMGFKEAMRAYFSKRCNWCDSTGHAQTECPAKSRGDKRMRVTKEMFNARVRNQQVSTHTNHNARINANRIEMNTKGVQPVTAYAYVNSINESHNVNVQLDGEYVYEQEPNTMHNVNRVSVQSGRMSVPYGVMNQPRHMPMSGGGLRGISVGLGEIQNSIVAPVDTCAEVNCMSMSLYTRITRDNGADLEDASIIYRGAGGNILECRGLTYIPMWIQLYTDIMPVKCLFAVFTDLHVDMLLGIPFIDLFVNNIAWGHMHVSYTNGCVGPLQYTAINQGNTEHNECGIENGIVTNSVPSNCVHTNISPSSSRTRNPHYHVRCTQVVDRPSTQISRQSRVSNTGINSNCTSVRNESNRNDVRPESVTGASYKPEQKEKQKQRQGQGQQSLPFKQKINTQSQPRLTTHGLVNTINPVNNHTKHNHIHAQRQSRFVNNNVRYVFHIYAAKHVCIPSNTECILPGYISNQHFNNSNVNPCTVSPSRDDCVKYICNDTCDDIRDDVCVSTFNSVSNYNDTNNKNVLLLSNQFVKSNVMLMDAVYDIPKGNGLNSMVPIRVRNVSKKDYVCNSGDELSVLSIVNDKYIKPAETTPTKHTMTWTEKLDSMLSQVQTLNAHMTEQLKHIIDKYNDVFDESQIGQATYKGVPVEHTINTGDHLPIRSRMYRASPLKDEFIQQEIAKGLVNGSIRPSHSPWASPVVVTDKKGNELRQCTDYRAVNEITETDAYPVPLISDMFDKLGKAKFFTIIDLKSAYNQISMREEDIPKTAFICKQGLYEYTRMPFGLKNAPGTFQRYMNTVFAGHKHIAVYFDDILVFSETAEQHITDIETALSILHEHGLRAKPSKCKFACACISYLGHVIDANGVHVDPEKVSGIAKYPVPTRVNELRSFLGLIGYYRNYIPKFSIIAAPLTQLFKKDIQWKWTNEHQNAFEQLRTVLLTAPVLVQPDFEQKFVLQTDASKLGVSAILTQIDTDNREHIIAAISRTLHDAETRYASTELECLAVVWAVKKFSHYLQGKHFTIQTDHSALKQVLKKGTKDKMNDRLEKMSLKMATFDFDVVYRVGKANANADALSRNPITHTKDNSHTTQVSINALTRADRVHNAQEVKHDNDILHDDMDVNVEIKNARDGKQSAKDIGIQDMMNKQVADKEIFDIIQCIKYNLIPVKKECTTVFQADMFRSKCNEFELVKKGSNDQYELLYHVYIPTDSYHQLVLQLYIPDDSRNEVMSTLHDDKLAGHVGWTKTYAKGIQKYYWPNMKQDIQKYCASCDVCNRRKTPKHIAGLPMLSPQQELIGLDNMDAIAMDVVGPLPSSGDKYSLILVVMCMRTRWVELYPLRQQTSEIIANILVKQWMMRYGIPARILSDKGTPFESRLTKQLCILLGIDKRRTTGYRPQTNGMVERFNGTIMDMIAKYTQDEHKQWSKCLPFVQFAYNTSVHSATGYTPYRMLFGCEANIGNTNLLLHDTDSYTTNYELVTMIENNIKDAHALTDMRIHRDKDKREDKNNNITSNGRHSAIYKIGQKVWIYKPPRTYGSKAKKLLSPWSGPYTIVEQKGPVTYRVQSDTTHKHTVVHASCMKLYTTNRIVNSDNEIKQEESDSESNVDDNGMIPEHEDSNEQYLSDGEIIDDTDVEDDQSMHMVNNNIPMNAEIHNRIPTSITDNNGMEEGELSESDEEHKSSNL